jgi:hypothetical protein
MNSQILRFFGEIDAELVKIAKAGERLDLYHIGRSALILQHELRASTEDIDVVELRNSPLERKARELFGKGSDKYRKLGMYLDLVPQGLPPVPQWFRGRCREVPGDWKVIRIWQLESHDLAASKLKSFRAQDKEDLRFMCDEGLLSPAELRKSLKSAFQWVADKDDDEGRDKAFSHLETVIAYIEGRGPL